MSKKKKKVFFILNKLFLDLNKISEEINFNEEEWNELINSDEIFTEQFSKSINSIDNSNVIINKKDIIKLSINDLKMLSFLNTNTFIRIDRSMNIIIPPSSNQRVRYEKECKNIFRYISVPNNKTMTIGVNKIFF
jgi:hypothetical protein